MNTGFLGRDGFIWFVGVVEDRHDPEKLGRVRVRALGYHTNDKAKIKTADLPWAQIMQPTGAMAGIGDSPIGLVEGSWVVGFFRDPETLQDPIIMGTLPGKNTKPAEQFDKLGVHRGTNNEWGFFDPTTVSSSLPYEVDDTTYRLSSSGTSSTKLAKGVTDETAKVHSYKEHFAADASPSSYYLDKEGPAYGKHTGLKDVFQSTRKITVDSIKSDGSFHNYGDDTAATNVSTDYTTGRKSVIASTGYLEDTGTRYTDGTPTHPLTTEKGTSSRVPHPRIDKVTFGNLTTRQKNQVKVLFDEGVYGNNEYGDLTASSSVVLPRADTNRLAQGGYKITNISITGVITLGSYSVKPDLTTGDSIQLSGIVGMEDANGQTFSLKAASLGASSGSVTISPPSGTYISGGTMLLDPHPVLKNKTDSREKQINVGGYDLNDDTSGTYTAKWNQPTSRYAAKYPYNHVYESESGHIKEFDDTPGAERIHEYHRSGTYYEIDQEGTKVDYVKGDRYNISVHDDYLYVKGNVVWTGDNEVLIASNDNLSLSSKWRLKVSSGGDIEIYSKRNINFRAEGDINMLAGGNINLEAEVTTDKHDNYKTPAGSRAKETLSNINLQSGIVTTKAVDGNISMFTTKGDISLATENPDTGGHISVFSKKGQIRVKAPDDNITLYSSTGEIHEQGANIYMNSGKATPDSPEEPEMALLTISQTADSVTTGTTGQGAGLGIDSTSGDNIRKLRK